jgi:uncharacterized membrane protein YeiH
MSAETLGFYAAYLALSVFVLGCLAAVAYGTLRDLVLRFTRNFYCPLEERRPADRLRR